MQLIATSDKENYHKNFAYGSRDSCPGRVMADNMNRRYKRY